MQHIQTEEQIREFLGVDKLLYQTQEDLVEAVTRRGEHHIKRPCMACMDGLCLWQILRKKKFKQLRTEAVKVRTES